MSQSIANSLNYWVDLRCAAKHLAKVTLSVPITGQSMTEFVFPVWTPGSYMVREYTRNIERISAQFQFHRHQSTTQLPNEMVEPTSATVVDLKLAREGKNRWIARHGTQGLLLLHYELYCRENTVRTNWLDVDYGFLTGAATFPWIEGNHDIPIQVDLTLPENWLNTASSLQLLRQSAQQVSYQAKCYDDLIDSPVVCGNFERHEFSVADRRHYFVNVGANELWDEKKVVSDIQSIIGEQHRFWSDNPYDSYWFLNLCTEAGGGLEHDNSTVLMTSRWAMGSRSSYLDWLSLVSHEFFHTWNVRRLRPKALMRYDYESEQFFKELWIAEGVTSYYDDLILARCGLCTTDELLARFSTTIQAVQCSVGRLNQSLAESSWDTWVKHYRPDENSPNSRISYYLKGSLLAMLLDARIRQATNQQSSLDDVMRQLWHDFRDIGYTHEDLAEIVEQLASPQVRNWLDAELNSTDELDFSPALEQFGLTFRATSTEEAVKRLSKFWVGCETAISEGKIIVRSVYRGSAADRAGVNVDDELISLGEYRLTGETWPKQLENWPIGTPLELLVARRGRIRRLCYESVAKPSHNWELAIDPNASQQKLMCWLRPSGAQ